MNKVTEKLVPGWKEVLKRSVAVWFAVLSVMLGLLEQSHAEFVQTLTLFQPYVPEGMFGWLSLLFAGGVPIARIYRQAKLAIAVEAANAKTLEAQE